jgi:hypothetical protein
MKKLFVSAAVVFILITTGCKKEDDLKLEWNTITIEGVTSTYANAGDCTTPGGFVGTNLIFTIDYLNPDNLNIWKVEFDVLYPDGNAFYGYYTSDYYFVGNDLVIERCRMSTSDAWIDYRFFIVSDDGLRSRPFVYRQVKPE